MKFLSLCACDRVIIDRQGAHSLINIMGSADVQPVKARPDVPAEFPPNAVLPNLWFIFSMWFPSKDEIGKTFQQAYQIFWPDGTQFSQGKTDFKPDENVQFNSFGILGFPAGQQGLVRIATWVEDKGKRITDTYEYSVRIKHAPPALRPVTAATQ